MFTKKICKNCEHFVSVASNTGFCTELAIVERGGGYILDSKKIFTRINWEIKPIEYKHVIVRSSFYCNSWSKGKNNE